MPPSRHNLRKPSRDSLKVPNPSLPRPDPQGSGFPFPLLKANQMTTVEDALSASLRLAASGTYATARAASAALWDAIDACPNDTDRDLLFDTARATFRQYAGAAGLKNWRAHWYRLLRC